MRHQHLVSFFAERSKHSTLKLFLSRKIDLAAHKVKFLGTYLILCREIMYIHPVKGNNHHAKRMDLIASNLIKLHSRYIGCDLVSEFS